MKLPSTEFFYTKAMKHSAKIKFHSQPETAQDKWVHNKLNKRNGFFIEIGAYDGVYHNNTLTLEKDFGWDGLLIEAIPKFATLASLNRKAKVLNYAVGPNCRRREFFIKSQFTGIKEFMPLDMRATHVIFNNRLETLQTIDLDTVLRPEIIPSIVDYLSIDTEGAEYPILETFFKTTTLEFRLLTIEIGNEQRDLDKLITLLEPRGYYLDQIKAWDAFFINPKLLGGDIDSTG